MTKFNNMAERDIKPIATQQMDTQPDEELVRCAQAGDGAAFDLLYERYLDRVYRRVRCSIPQADVEDVTQEVFIAVIRSLKEFRGDSKFRTWLYTILSRKIADYYRRRDPVDFQPGNNRNSDPMDVFEKIPGGTNFSTVDDIILVRQALQRLPAHYREIILMRFVDDLPFLEIAQLNGQTLEATKSLFRRAISNLQEVLEEAHA